MKVHKFFVGKHFLVSTMQECFCKWCPLGRLILKEAVLLARLRKWISSCILWRLKMKRGAKQCSAKNQVVFTPGLVLAEANRRSPESGDQTCGKGSKVSGIRSVLRFPKLWTPIPLTVPDNRRDSPGELGKLFLDSVKTNLLLRTIVRFRWLKWIA